MSKKPLNTELLEHLIEFAQRKFGGKFGWKKKLADSLEMSQAQISNILSGTDPIGPAIKEKLRKKLGYDIDRAIERGQNDIEPGIIELMHIPVYESVHAGRKQGIVAEHPIEYIAIPKSNDNTQIGVKVRGGSMEPKIAEGDVVVISRQAEVKSGDLCLVNWSDGEYCLRYVHFKDQLVTLSSENSRENPPESIHKSKIHSIFRVMRLIKEF